MMCPLSVGLMNTNRVSAERIIVTPIGTDLNERADLHVGIAPACIGSSGGVSQSCRMAVGSIPNMRRCVRVRCDESAKPDA